MTEAKHDRPVWLILALIAPQILIAAFVFWRGSNPDDYMKAIRAKHKTAAALNEQPNILLVGGSSVAWGSDSDEFSEQCDMPCINLAINAGQGLNYRFNEAFEFAESGDVIVLSIEYYAMTRKPAGFVATNTFVACPEAITLASWREFRACFDDGLFDLMARRTRSAATAMMGKPKFDEFYKASNFNAVGDFVGHHGQVPKDQKNWGLQFSDDVDQALEWIAAFEQKCKAKNVQVFYRLPCVPESLARIEMEKLSEIESKLKEIFGNRVLNELDETLLSDASFFDTSYHLIDNQQAEVSRMLAERLKTKLNDSR